MVRPSDTMVRTRSRAAQGAAKAQIEHLGLRSARHRRPLLRRLEPPHRPALDHHVHRPPGLGQCIQCMMISAGWYKTVNVLNKLPKSLQAKATRALQDIWMAETKTDALAAFDAFVETYGVKYDKAVACLVKDRDALLAFYDFPAEHWKHLRTTNP